MDRNDLSQFDGNSHYDIDYGKTFLAQKTGWTIAEIYQDDSGRDFSAMPVIESEDEIVEGDEKLFGENVSSLFQAVKDLKKISK